MPERGLRLDDRKDGQMMAMILEKKCVHFIKQPEAAIISVVREFYANVNPEGSATAQVRGYEVAFDSKTINELFAMPNYDGKDYLEPGLGSYDLDDIVKRLCKPGTTWVTNEYTGEKTSFPHQTLSRYGKVWYNFICSNMMPIRHHSDFTKERATLLFAMVTRLKVDIRFLIQEFIRKAIKITTSGKLPHPSLITRLCKRAKVHWEPADITQSPMAIIDNHVILRFSVWDGTRSYDRGEGFLPAT